jgi:hypothetical protein
MTTEIKPVARVARVARVALAAGDAGDAGLVSYPTRKNAPPPLIDGFTPAIPGPAWGSWGWPWSTASGISADDADDADDSPYPIGKLSERQIYKWVGNKPRIARITRKPFWPEWGSFWAFLYAGRNEREIPLGHAHAA